MRVFLVACLAIVVLAVGGYFGANAVQRMSGVAYSTEGARINPSWSWRSAHGTATDCDIGTTWRWILVDFSRAAKDAPDCR